WVAYCADNLARVRLPERLREVQIAVDMDESGKGRQVADALKARVRRWSPRTRIVYISPELDGPGDLNDELRRRAG
ncbi:MAG TPA: toprim domain-containing protein, partial [Steroidobacteraceae bacterium]|nr:toprim domain-containing protein [Steroidobacteraceae bacterium]